MSEGPPATGPPAPPPPGPVDPAVRAAALAHVRTLLLEAGATSDEIDRAAAEDVLDLLTVDRLLVPGPRRYTQREVAELTGLPLDLVRRFWRALGFADVGEGERAFTDLDIEAVQLFLGMVRLGATEVETALQLARVIGSSMARIAEAEVAPGTMGIGSDDDSVLAADAFASVADAAVPAMARLLEFVWRRHVQAATRRTMLLRTVGHGAGVSPVLVVGFADMVGFTLLSQHLGGDDLADVVRRFEEISHDIVTGLGGRVVKMIGDEAMFVVDNVVAAARIGLGLAEAYADDELLSDVRVGLAVGPVLLHDGDYYGPTVNLAHRIVNIANPGTVLVSDQFHTDLVVAAPDEFTGQALRPRVLKDLGRVQLWWCGRAGQAPDGAGTQADRRRNVRWERLAEVLRDLDDLREVGERLFSRDRRTTQDGDPGVSDVVDAQGGDPRGP
ncbi:MAG: adenylate cyclase regulatory domain-containing protein [Acidimicrobiales bacterium]